MLGHRLSAVCICELHLESGGITAASAGSATRGENTACLLLRLLHLPPENIVMTASSSLLACVLLTLGSANSANSVNSKALDLMNRISKTLV